MTCQPSVLKSSFWLNLLHPTYHPLRDLFQLFWIHLKLVCLSLTWNFSPSWRTRAPQTRLFFLSPRQGQMSARNANSNLAEDMADGSIFHVCHSSSVINKTAGKIRRNNKNTCSTRGSDLQWSWYVVSNHSFRLNFWWLADLQPVSSNNHGWVHVSNLNRNG